MSPPPGQPGCGHTGGDPTEPGEREPVRLQLRRGPAVDPRPAGEGLLPALPPVQSHAGPGRPLCRPQYRHSAAAAEDRWSLGGRPEKTLKE